MTDLIVIDGGSSVAERHYVDEVRGDVAWFAQEFAAALVSTLDAATTQGDAAVAAAHRLHRDFVARTQGQEVPAYAWPIAAMTWARIRRVEGGQRLQLYSLGDCKTLLRTAEGRTIDLDPFVNPQEAVLQAEIARLVAQGLTDAAQRKARLLPMLRERRVQQNAAASPSILCLKPAGPFAARTLELRLDPGAALLVMTDGFYRLVDPYGLHTDASLVERCAEAGLNAVLEELRAFESGSVAGGALTVKRADDASAVLWLPD
ncbi:hypothetical protein [Massilia sp. KIM]|uniref:hypothetical protein n=1 Tax=Massilia sp. KIM TaxID=1955422 RepID=UPI001E60A070